MRIESLRRYPVKSMLGEAVESLFVDEHGAEGDRRLALIDTATGHVASAKQARLWRGLLKCTANGDAGRVSIGLPDGTKVPADDPGVNELLSRLLGRAVRLVSKRPDGATVERPDPDKLLELGLDAEVAGRILEIGLATPGDSFTDDAPLHAITTATLEHIGVEALRYRPNLVIATPAGYPPYAENDWVGREFGIGRPYLDRDPPHVAPIDGQEYAKHRPGRTRQAASSAKNGNGHAPAKHARTARSSRVRTI